MERWRGRSITEITRADVRAVVEAKRDQGKDPKTGKGGHPAQARNLLGYAKRLFGWALDNEIISASPAQTLRTSAIIGEREPRDRHLSDEELRVVWRAIDNTPYPYGPILKLLVLTGQRRSEVSDATWGEFDLSKRDPITNKSVPERIIPTARMKKKKKYVVPLTAEAVEIIESLPRFKSGQHLFSASHGVTPVNGFAKAKERIDKLTGKMDPWVFDDLRRTVRTNLSKIKTLDFETRERMLAHAQGKMSRTYDHYDYLEEKRIGFELWAARLHSILNPPNSNVVALRR